jgi:hypothetical protein
MHNHRIIWVEKTIVVFKNPHVLPREKDLTFSMRGLPRPHDDSYFPKLINSDPVYAVCGRKA